jgi:single-strand DNA-binding protein
VYIEGRIRTREWDDRDGNKRRTTEIIANQMVLLGARPEGVESAPAPMQRSAPEGEPGLTPTPGLADVEITDDDIPF